MHGSANAYRGLEHRGELGPNLIEVRVLGPLEIVGREGPIALGARKQRQLLAALLVRRGDAVSTDWLIDALWGEEPPDSASKLVQVYVSALRKRLPDSISIRTQPAGYALECPPSKVDADRFEHLVDEAGAGAATSHPARIALLLWRALELWRGPAYGEFADEPFAVAEVARLDSVRLAAIETRNEIELGLGRHMAMLPELQVVADENPLRERLQAQLMLALYRAGRQADALERYLETRRHLRDELGIDPGEELEVLQHRILRHDPELSVATSRDEVPDALPVPPTPLIGRRRELADLHELLLDDGMRFVVLAGAGGSGKTRLALEVAHDVARSFANGAVFVDLAPVHDPALLAETLARALGATTATGDPLEAAVEYLAPREMLVLLDNAEQLRAAGPLLAQLLARAPHLKILVTSRVVLHVRGEHVYPVGPLPGDDAAALFQQRMREIEPRLELTAEDQNAIRHICRRLDGLPLAIELAASRVRALSPSELVRRLEPRLPLLVGGPRDLPARQQTLRATIEWSHDLLDPMARQALARLSVFVGGFTLQAAESIAGVELDALQSLVEHSLLRRADQVVGPGLDRQFMTLETIREFSAERLDESGERESISRRHAEFFLGVAESAGLLWESDRPQQYDLVAAEIDNLRAAIDWAAGRDVELALSIATALEAFWATVSPFEGARLLESLISGASGLPGDLRARALRVWGAGLTRSGHIEAGTERYEQSLREFRGLGDQRGAGGVLTRLAGAALATGNRSEARRLAQEGLELLHRSGFPKGESVGLTMLGEIEFLEGDHDAGLATIQASVAMAGTAGFAWWQAQALFLLAELTHSVGRRAEAMGWCRETLRISHRIGDWILSVSCIALITSIQDETGDGLLAARLRGFVEHELARRPPITGWLPERHAFEPAVSRGDPPAIRAAREEGAQLSLSAAVALILGDEAATTP